MSAMRQRSKARCFSHSFPSDKDSDNEYVPDSENEGGSQLNSGRKPVGNGMGQVSDSDNEENAPARLAKLIQDDEDVDKRRNRNNKSRSRWRKNVQRVKDTLDHTEEKRLFPDPGILEKKDTNPSLGDAVVSADDSRDAGQKEAIPEDIGGSASLSRAFSKEDSVSRALGASLASVDASSSASLLYSGDMNRDGKRPVTEKKAFPAEHLPRTPCLGRKGMEVGENELEEEEVESPLPCLLFLPSLAIASSSSAGAVAVVARDMMEGGSGRGRAGSKKKQTKSGRKVISPLDYIAAENLRLLSPGKRARGVSAETNSRRSIRAKGLNTYEFQVEENARIAKLGKGRAAPHRD